MSSDGSDREFYGLVKEKRKTEDYSQQFIRIDAKIWESRDEVCEG